MLRTATRFVIIMSVILITYGENGVRYANKSGFSAFDTGRPFAVRPTPGIANVVFPSGAKAEMGNILSPQQVKSKPLVTWYYDRILGGGWYAMCLLEPDNERSWAPDNLIGYRHWLVVNIQSGGTDDSGETLTKYEVCKTTNELSGRHRYLLFVYSQPSYMDFGRYREEKKNFNQRVAFNLTQFSEEFKLNDPVFNNTFWVDCRHFFNQQVDKNEKTISHDSTNKEDSKKKFGLKLKSQKIILPEKDSQEQYSKESFSEESSSKEYDSNGSCINACRSNESKSKQSSNEKSNSEETMSKEFDNSQNPNEGSDSDVVYSSEENSEESSSEESNYEDSRYEDSSYEDSSYEKSNYGGMMSSDEYDSFQKPNEGLNSDVVYSDEQSSEKQSSKESSSKKPSSEGTHFDAPIPKNPKFNKLFHDKLYKLEIPLKT